SLLINFARAAFALYSGRFESTEFFTSDTFHSSSGFSIERWYSAPFTHSKRRRPSGVRRAARSRPPSSAAGPGVYRFGYAPTVPWQSLHSISTADATSP